MVKEKNNSLGVPFDIKGYVEKRKRVLSKLYSLNISLKDIQSDIKIKKRELTSLDNYLRNSDLVEESKK